MEIPSFHNLDAVALLLQAECDADSLWGETDFHDLWLMQLDAVLWTDCEASVGQVPALWIHQSAHCHNPKIQTYRDLFWHESPSLELLKAIQNVAQTLLHMYEPSVPSVVARALYDMAVLMALEKWNERTSELAYPEIEKSMSRFITLPWVDIATQQRCLQLVRMLQRGHL